MRRVKRSAFIISDILCDENGCQSRHGGSAAHRLVGLGFSVSACVFVRNTKMKNIKILSMQIQPTLKMLDSKNKQMKDTTH